MRLMSICTWTNLERVEGGLDSKGSGPVSCDRSGPRASVESGSADDDPNKRRRVIGPSGLDGAQIGEQALGPRRRVGGQYYCVGMESGDSAGWREGRPRVLGRPPQQKRREEKLVSGAARVPEWGASGRGLTRSGPRNNEDENQPGKGSVPVPCPLSDLSIFGVD